MERRALRLGAAGIVTLAILGIATLWPVADTSHGTGARRIVGALALLAALLSLGFASLAYVLGASRARGAARADLAAQGRTQDALQRIAQQYQRVVEEIEQVIFQLDTEGRVTFLSRAWQALTGRDLQASVGHSFVGYLHPDDQSTAQMLCGDLLACRKDECRQDLRLVTAEGSARWTAVHARPLIEDGVVTGIAGTITDITARRLVQQELEQARVAAEQASAAKSEFLKSMSHEMRTPLNGVLGLMELLARTELDEQQARYVAVARASATHLATLITDILDLSRIEAGSLALERTLFDLPDLVESSLDAVVADATARRLQLSCTVAPEVPTWVVGDAGRLRQVLMSLLANAVKFTEQGGVHVQAEAEVDRQSRKALLRLEVQDTGVGLSADLVERLFLPLDAPRLRRPSGTGLGLTICRRLVEAMHGTITVRSVAGGGATFSVVLPIEVADAAMVESDRQGAHERVKAPQWARPLRLLVAEDHDINQMVAREMLQAMGTSVDLVANGEQAVAAALAAPYDVILMDCQMPVLDGLEATRRIRRAVAEGRTPHAPKIIALTANATAEDRQACLDAGMDAYLTKPVRGAVLQRTLQRLLGMDALAPAAAAAPDVPAVPARPAPASVNTSTGPTLGEAPDAEDILDPAEVLLRCNNNGDLGARMLELFAESLPSELEAIDAAAAAGDTDALGRIAHKLRGAASTLAAVRLAGAITGLELFLKHGDGGPIADLLADVRHESALLLGVVPQIVRRLTEVE